MNSYYMLTDLHGVHAQLTTNDKRSTTGLVISWRTCDSEEVRIYAIPKTWKGPKALELMVSSFHYDFTDLMSRLATAGFKSRTKTYRYA